MAEAVVGVVIEQLVSATTEWLMEEISLIRGVENKMKNMSTKMKQIQKVLDNAENKSIKDPNQETEEWLDKVHDVSYEMEDVLDEWNTIVGKQKLEQEAEQNNTSSNQKSSSSPSTSPSPKFSCLSLKQLNCFKSIKQVGWRRDIASRIKIINEQVDIIFKEMAQFEFISKKVGSLAPDANNFEIDRVTTSFVITSSIHGRDVEKEALVNKLCENNEQGDAIVVVSIVGLGGLGKTTLAQLVFNDERVTSQFEKRIWICVSNTFDEIKVAKGILEALEVNHQGKNELETLHRLIQSSLSKHKFLLVLDDVWTEEPEKWDRLRACLETRTQGCRVLITTRSDLVATVMNTSEANMLKPKLISDHDCWMLMSRVAFQRKRKEDNVNKFENIGREIAKRCKGLPIAAKTLGGLLILKSTIEEWREVLNSEIWKLEQAELQLFPHLFLSYKELPSALKRCFIFYSIFPKDHEISVEELISQWTAHGYVNPTKQIHEVEQVGQDYFRYLSTRSFFEVREEYGSTFATMHDIMHDFALHLSRNNFLTFTRDGNNQESKKAQHLFIRGDEDPLTVCDVGRLRTCLGEFVPPNVTLSMFGHLKLVRTLSLKWCKLDQIPPEIGELIHLRTLDLSGNWSLSELPETIGDLYNLKCLFLEHVNLNKFPESFGKLINLRILAVDLEKWKLLARESLAKLVNLRRLMGVPIEAGSRGLGFLKNLNKLRDDLEIVFESDYIDDGDANEANLKSKKHIKKLTFNFKGNDVAESVVDALEPSKDIEVVKFVEFIGTELPTWLTSLNNLTELEVSSAANVVSLPPIGGKLPYLQKLNIPSKLWISPEEVGEGAVGPLLPPFPNLDVLEIEEYMGPRLPSWISCLNFFVKDLRLDGAAEVQSLPPLGHLPFLESLYIIDCPALKLIGREFVGIDIEKKPNTSSTATASIAYFPKLTHLELKWLDSLKEWEDIRVDEEEDTSLHFMPNLYYLTIEGCPRLEVLPHRLFHKASLLQELLIGDDEERAVKSSASFEAVFGPMVTAIPKLQDFVIGGLVDPKLPSWITSLNYLTDLTLVDSKNVSSLPPLGKLPCLEKLSISNMSVLKSVGREFLGIEDENILTASITSFPNLKELRIEWCDELEEWEDIKAEDDAITLMPNLRELSIEGCWKFEGLPHRLLRRASSPSIMELRIFRCGIARETIVEDTELFLRLKAVKIDGENLKEKERESDDN